MHERTFEETAMGRWVVIVDDSYIERFFKEKDAKEYCKFCEDNSISAYVHHIETDFEDDNLWVILGLD